MNMGRKPDPNKKNMITEEQREQRRLACAEWRKKNNYNEKIRNGTWAHGTGTKGAQKAARKRYNKKQNETRANKREEERLKALEKLNKEFEEKNGNTENAGNG